MHRRLIRALAYFVAALLLTACATVGTLNSAFDPNAANFIKQTGKGGITGQAFLRRNDGIVVYAAGSEVSLLPKTPHTDEIVSKMFGSSRFAYTKVGFNNQDPRFIEYIKTTTADGEGRFTFSSLPNGSYYLITSVVWFVNDWQQGGGLLLPVSVSGGEVASVIMSGQ